MTNKDNNNENDNFKTIISILLYDYMCMIL